MPVRAEKPVVEPLSIVLSDDVVHDNGTGQQINQAIVENCNGPFATVLVATESTSAWASGAVCPNEIQIGDLCRALLLMRSITSRNCSIVLVVPMFKSDSAVGVPG